MRMLLRNQQSFYYALYGSATEIVDDYGNATGTYTITYGAPVLMKANISAARGTADVEMFGINTPYTKTIITGDMSCPIKEDSILWIGITPDSSGEAGAIKHNYAVVAVAKSLNSITYAVKEVNVSGAAATPTPTPADPDEPDSGEPQVDEYGNPI